MVNSPAHAAHPPHAIHPIRDERTGLEGVIVLHSLHLGPAAGGCRFWHYDSPCDMMGDAIRLARGMSYKNAMADLPLGGGKAVLNVPRDMTDRSSLFRAFGRAVEKLGGQYITAEDVGTNVQDMVEVARQTRYVAGLTAQAGKPGGDPSPHTAKGVFLAMQAAIDDRLARPFDQLTIAVQGLGNVGMRLCAHLHAKGAKLIVADVNDELVRTAMRRFGAIARSPQEILTVKADIFAPCALGGVISNTVIPHLSANIICGGANNQLHSPEIADALQKREILYVPDYVANAGGIINVAAEYFGWSTHEVDARVGAIGARVAKILADSAAAGISASALADDMAQAKIHAMRVVEQGAAGGSKIAMSGARA